MVLWTVDQGWNSIIILNTIKNRLPSWEILFYSIRSRNLFPRLHLFSRHLLLGNFFNFNFIFSSWHHLLAFCQDHLYVTWWTHVRCNQQGKQHIKLPIAVPIACVAGTFLWQGYFLAAELLRQRRGEAARENPTYHISYAFWMPHRFQIGLYPFFSWLHCPNNTTLLHYSIPASYAGYSTQVICGA